jgi:excisionase family DNA binding protein
MKSIENRLLTFQQLLVTSKDAAKMLSVSERTLWSLTNMGKLRRIKVGASVRYAVKDLEEFVEAKLRNDLTEN